MIYAVNVCCCAVKDELNMTVLLKTSSLTSFNKKDCGSITSTCLLIITPLKHMQDI